MMAGTDASLRRFESLVSAQGRELLDRLAAERVDPRAALRLGEKLRARYPTELVVDAFAQHELRLRAAEKFGRAMEMFFTRSGLEQASSETVARYRARRYRGLDAVADLCTGIGGDLVALAVESSVLAVDRDLLHLRMAEVNADVHNVPGGVSPALADVREVELPDTAAVFVDPARRAAGRRMRAGDSEPPLAWCVGLAERVAAVGVKATPAVPHDVVPNGWELELIAVGRDLKEGVLCSPRLRSTDRRATILPEEHSLEPRPGPPVPVHAPGEFLLDPNPAVTRAGLVEDLARRLGAWQIDHQIAFLSADEPPRTPFGRTLRVVDSAPWHEKRLPAKLRALDVGAVDVRRRGLAGDVDRLQRRLRLTGTRRATVVMTTVGGRPWGLVCVEPE